jgi:hypothetical protein
MKYVVLMKLLKSLKILSPVIGLSLVLPFALLAQPKPNNRPPNLPLSIPPPPNFGGGSSQNGKYLIMSGEYYSQDDKPFLYKRLIKLDTTTGNAWVLYSKIGPKGEVRKWIPLENSNK